MEIRHVVQAALFFLLLFAVAVCDMKNRQIPDGLQAGIAALCLLNFSPWNLFGILAAAPYLMVALWMNEKEGIGGGDVKLAASTGIVLGLPVALAASFLGLVFFLAVCGSIIVLQQKEEQNRQGFPLGPFLAVGAAIAYLWEMEGGFI